MRNDRINNQKFRTISNNELATVYGGGWLKDLWEDWDVVGYDDCGNSLEQRSNWFGLHATTEMRSD